MRVSLFFLLVFCINSNVKLFGQAGAVELEGSVSYVSSQNVYVKFASTKAITIGDTLFQKNGESLAAALLVSNKSSGSCVCSRLVAGQVFKVGDTLLAKVLEEIIPPKPDISKKEKAENEPDAEGQVAPPDQAAKEAKRAQKPKISAKQKLRVRLSAGSYSNFYNDRERHRLRYGITVQGNRINGSRWSTENNIVFRHTIDDWAEVRENVNNALKIYSLSAKYNFTEGTSITVGRRINPRMASIGAIDGLQFERGFAKKFQYGAVIGSRPNFSDYSFDAKLFETGAYLGYSSVANNKSVQATAGFMEQKNHWLTDRRFLYFQQNADLTTHLNLFASAEVDLFEKINEVVKNEPRLTNLFVSARYRFSKKLNATLSYDNRRNVIFYESFKVFIDQYTELETRQGLRLHSNFRASKMINVGANANLRFQKTSSNNTQNLNCYVNLNRIPVLKTSASLTANFLKTSYIDSKTYGLRLTKDFFKGKMNGEAYGRYVDYQYTSGDYSANQKVVGGSISFNFLKKTAFFLFAEKSFDSRQNDFLLFNTKVTQRF